MRLTAVAARVLLAAAISTSAILVEAGPAGRLDPGAPASATAVPRAANPATVAQPAPDTRRPATGPAPVTLAAATSPSWCRYSSQPLARADELMANRYLLPPHPIVTLPANPTWRENPLHDANWQFQYHAMRYVLDLFSAWTSTGNRAYRDRALFLLRDWAANNPRWSPPSAYSWNDHSTALRAAVYACAADLTPMTTWLRNALVLHGQTLADPSFYVGIGNHALNQSIGLLEVGRVLGRRDWMTLARDRLNRLVLRSVDEQGVTNEQSTFYQAYNYNHYRLAQSRLLAVGLSPGSGFARVALMPNFLATSALPNGQYEMIGDTEADPIPNYRGTWTEFVATKGASGPRPPTVAAYADGYQFGRTGWGTRRAFADETYVSIRWGAAPRTAHGHPDGTSVTLYGWGTRLLVPAGKYTFNSGAWRSYFTSRRANNVVTVDGLGWNRGATTTRIGRTVTSTLVDVRLQTNGFAGVTQTRRVTWSRRLGYLLVEDRATSTTSHVYRQLWHLVDGSSPTIGTRSVWTNRPRGNVLIRQLVGTPALRLVTGATDPIQGWISYQYGTKVAAPVVQAIRSGTSVRYLTLIAPSEGAPNARVTSLRLTSGGYAVTITVDGRSERVIASGSTVSITPLN